jgi:hypothetical protein
MTVLACDTASVTSHVTVQEAGTTTDTVKMVGGAAHSANATAWAVVLPPVLVLEEIADLESRQAQPVDKQRARQACVQLGGREFSARKRRKRGAAESMLRTDK